MKTFNYALTKIKDPKTKQWKNIPVLKGESAYEIAVRLGTFSGTEEDYNNDIINISVMRDIMNKTPHATTAKKYYNLKRTGKVYQTKVWKFATNPTTTCEKLLDNAGLEFTPSTDTVEGKDDYLNGDHPLFEWVYCNYKRNDDGTPYPIATEFDSNYAESGSVDIGAMQMSFYWNWDASNPAYDLVTISDMPNEKYGLKPWTECVGSDGTILPYCIGSAFFSGTASDGLLHSQPNIEPQKYQSYNNIMTNYPKKGKGYKGAGVERNTFGIIFDIIKGANKSSQKIHSGCTNYNLQYNASIVSDDPHDYFPVTNAQATNLVVGSIVSVGYGSINGTSVNNDRSVTTMHKYVNNKRISKIETLDSNNKAIYFEGNITPFNTAKVKLNDTLSANVIISTMPWYSGTTKNVIGKHDGSFISNTSGKYPYRVQGREYAVGGYSVASNVVMIFKSDYSKDVYVAQKGVTRTSDEAKIKSTYKLIGNIPGNDGTDFWIGDTGVDVETGGTYPKIIGSSDSQGTGDRCYAGGKTTSGTREYLQGGNLGDGSVSGSSYVDCWLWLSSGGWNCLGAD